jgi:hypothetical protein
MPDTTISPGRAMYAQRQALGPLQPSGTEHRPHAPEYELKTAIRRVENERDATTHAARAINDRGLLLDYGLEFRYLPLTQSPCCSILLSLNGTL